MDILTRFDSDLVGRLHGPLTLRFFLQPLMALVVAVVLALAFVPYLLWRGLANRLARWWMPKREHAR